MSPSAEMTAPGGSARRPPGADRAAVADRLAIALDTDDLVAATRLARAVRPWFGVAKVGLELFAAAGPDAVAVMHELGFRVFLDLKMHDIPTTVGRAARVAGGLGVSYLTLHTLGGVEMLAAGVEGLASGARDAGGPSPVVLAVTVLTSDAAAGPDALDRRVGWALEAGCGGVVTAAANVARVRELGAGLFVCTPGIRLAGGSADDHADPATPRAALDAGSDLLVIGRAVSGAPDPAAAAAEVAAAAAG